MILSFINLEKDVKSWLWTLRSGLDNISRKELVLLIVSLNSCKRSMIYNSFCLSSSTRTVSISYHITASNVSWTSIWKNNNNVWLAHGRKKISIVFALVEASIIELELSFVQATLQGNNLFLIKFSEIFVNNLDLFKVHDNDGMGKYCSLANLSSSIVTQRISYRNTYIDTYVTSR